AGTPGWPIVVEGEKPLVRELVEVERCELARHAEGVADLLPAHGPILVAHEQIHPPPEVVLHGGEPADVALPRFHSPESITKGSYRKRGFERACLLDIGSIS